MSKKHGHHGGAWKVAYADFVTAMMALFLVLWLTSQDEKIKEAIQRSFTNPFASLTKESSGIIPNKDVQPVSADKSGNFDSSSALELAMLRRLSEDLIRALEKSDTPEEDKPMKLELTPEGLKISIFDRSRRPLFEPQTAEFTSYGDWVMSTLAWQISLYSSFAVELEGHTESGQEPLRADYGDWEISTDRAGAARRKLIEHGVSTGQIRKVAGFGDTVPMPQSQPEEESNRRITVMLKIRSAKNANA
ncbi:MAG TPA: flagellar motor protein MotB [Verrucomicrobiae bacterium]|jgi:chemotaxis protein MotB|nr:flagellar motor protein MotB [Verrucomicrobiae bacterium]